MALYVIGDVQGCMASLERLLSRIGFGRSDRLWLVGDLVNRGPRSLDVLRWASRQGDAVTAVLGNHDLHLLARIAGVAAAKKRDTLDEVLAAPDRDDLCDWLRARPLVHVEAGHVLVHAGLHPTWSAGRARELAGEIEAELRGPRWQSWLAGISGSGSAWRDDLVGEARARAILGFLVRVRMMSPDGVPSSFDGPPDQAPPGAIPWFSATAPAWGDHVPVFGHWAALGHRLDPRWISTDSGCVWGERLTAVRLPDRAVFQVDSVEAGR